MSGPPIAPGRSCGACSECCRLLHVIELAKPAGVWCPHCRPGAGGCSIYEMRPSICRSFACGWLMSSKVSDDWFPLDCHMVLSLAVFNGIQTVTVTVDPEFPDAWRKHPHFAQLKMMATRGLRVRVPEDILLVHVRVHDRVWLVLPDEDVEITRGSYIVKLVADGQWTVEQFVDPQQAAVRVEELTQHSR